MRANKYDEALIKWADSRETSIDIAKAIWAMSDNLVQAQSIWEGDDESISQRVISLAKHYNCSQDDKFFWGKTVINNA